MVTLLPPPSPEVRVPVNVVALNVGIALLSAAGELVWDVIVPIEVPFTVYDLSVLILEATDLLRLWMLLPEFCKDAKNNDNNNCVFFI